MFPPQFKFIQDKFRPDESKESDRDVAERNFDLLANTIFVQFQYAKDAITASTRLYHKPPKADYGCETAFIPGDTKAYNVGSNIFYIMSYNT